MANERSDVSICVKYLVFFFNVFFWVIGGLMIAVGLYARLEKTAYQEFFSDILTDPAFALIIVGCVMFILGFSGCIGALRENICLLKFFSVFLAIIFFLQLSLAVAAFVFQDKMEQVIVDKLRVAIKNYRDNYDLQNLIDGVQTEFKCCGGRTINDWDQNIYFNCSSPGSESCGVPFSCCKEDTINRQCGYKIRKKGVSSSDRSSKIYTKGCVDSVKDWFKENLIIIGGVAVGVALLQIMGICFANSLMSDIKMQKKRWNRDYPSH